ncbi:MAG TPA: hypothetical protein PKD10_01060 [Paracoccaceae bacterium]|nr:hypothetical protein [Paracoccaceae bacterium]HMO71252.1 hypothetical protein [Paracoccaceae bacterium]
MTTLRLALAAFALSAMPALAGQTAFDLPRLDFGTAAATSTSGAPASACTAPACPVVK